MTTNLSRHDAQRRSAAVQLHSYQVHIDVRDAAHAATETFRTSTIIEFTTSDPLVQVDFIGHNVHDVRVGGQRRPIEYDGACLTVRDLPVGESVTLVVEGEGYYSRMGQGLCRTFDGSDDQVFLYTHAEPADARRFFACFDQPDLKAPITMHLTGPSAWRLLGNGAEVERVSAGRGHGGEALSTVTFAPTPPLSTYLTCVAAGPYEVTEGEWTGTTPDGSQLTVPIRVYVRPSQRNNADPAFIIDLTQRGLSFFLEEYDYTYPWGKYDYVFAPDYNAGAMENPGLVTMSEATKLHPSTASDDHLENCCITVMHEMSHMWFGDLVTPAWWDDLWLKESFAEFAGVDATSRATRFEHAWTNSVIRRKYWAYEYDGRPTTHPVLADIPDVEAASQNFDGITYSKGAACLRQLVEHVGREPFTEATRRYFKRHEFGATSMGDFMAELEAASGRDVQAWTDLWLGTSGVSELHATVQTEGNTIGSLTLHQHGVDPITGRVVLRPHTVAVGLYSLQDGQLVRTHRLLCDLSEETLEVSEAAGLPVPDLVLVNDEDLTYASVVLRPEDVEVLRHHLHTIADPLSRASATTTLQSMVRFGHTEARAAIEAAIHALAYESQAVMVRTLIERSLFALRFYAAHTECGDLAQRLLGVVWDRLHATPPGTPMQGVWLAGLAQVSSLTGERADQVRGIVTGQHPLPEFTMTSELEWMLWWALAATGNVTEDELRAAREKDTSPQAHVRYLQAHAALPTNTQKEQVRRRVLTDHALSNHELLALVDGYGHVGPGHSIAGFTAEYLSQLTDVWATRSQRMAEIVVKGMFPHHVVADADLAPAEHEVPRMVAGWLDTHSDAPAALRSLVTAQLSDLLRSITAQQLSLRTAPVTASHCS